jgi:hypothetical protein
MTFKESMLPFVVRIESSACLLLLCHSIQLSAVCKSLSIGAAASVCLRMQSPRCIGEGKQAEKA